MASCRLLLSPERALPVVVLEIRFQRLLHLFHRLVPHLPALNTEMLIEQGPVQTFHRTAALRAAHLGRAMLDAFKLEKLLIRSLSGLPQNSRPLSERVVSMRASCSPKRGSTSSLSPCTAVSGSLLVHRRPQP